MWELKKVKTFRATVYVGFSVGRTAERTRRFSLDQVLPTIQKFVDGVEPGSPGGCVTVTETLFVYKGGCEPGIAVGFINYPRFPSDAEKITKSAWSLARILKKKCRQLGVSVVADDVTTFFGRLRR